MSLKFHKKLFTEDFEIIVVLEGVVETTGMTTQVRTSYLPSEIQWGYRLSPLLTFRRDNGSYEIDYGRFHETSPVDMPEASAAYMAEMAEKEQMDENDNNLDSNAIEDLLHGPNKFHTPH